MQTSERAALRAGHPVSLVDKGLGNSTYLLDLGDGRALAVDPSRDLRSLRAAAQRSGLRVAVAADTHLHADFLTGALDLAASDGAQVVAAPAGGRHYEHRGVVDGDEVDLGGLTLRVLATPGHTHEHVAYLLLDAGRPLGVFTGGSLLVGAAARTDLVDPARTEELARAQWRSLQRLAALPDEVAVWPTHGAGSFCSAPATAPRTSTIGAERAANALLRAGSEDAFVDQLLASLGSFPPYFLRLADLNRRGPRVVGGTPALAGLAAADVRARQQAGAVVIDVRPAAEFAAGHVPGSVSIPLRAAFATWLGWLVPADRPLVVVRNDDQDPGEIVWQALKIGYEDVAGELAGGLTAWAATGAATAAIPFLTADALVSRPGAVEVLDVRQRSEYEAGHVPGAQHVELGALGGTRLPRVPMVVMCGHGERAMTAASLLRRRGHDDLAVLSGGPQAWAQAAGARLQAGG